ncbi:MAG TPA: AAA family ATPase, partial [Polyangiaceae bacterium]|nr:AAA family ATPase [Polyangiaceae bacterium]
MQAAIAASKGERIGPYRLLELIGEGGMGRVHRAEHLATGRFCALKTVKQMSPERSLALRMEIAALRAVDHAGVVRIEDEGIHNGLPWYAMELLRGQTLAAYHRDLGSAGPESSSGSSFSPTTDPISGVQPISRILSSTALAKKVADVPTLGLYRALCEPLAHIHGRGMVHRDLKPANVFVRHDGTPVLMDFGLIGYARGAVGREILDAGDRVLGSIHYIAPERIEGRLVDARADLYSLGCMLYEAVTGRPPFVGAPREVLAQHVAACPVPPSEFVSGLPPDVEDLILALLAKAPRARIGHASDVAERLGRALGHAEIARPSHAAPLYRPELSGREDILASLDDFVQQARGGRGAMILLGGESGIGKTFLCSEFAFRAGRNGFRVITGECIGLSAPIAGSRDVSSGPLHPLRRFLQAVADICHERGSDDRQRILGDAAAYLAPYEPCLSVFAEPTTEVRAASLPGPARSEVVLAVLTETLRQFAVDAPVLLILDDLQWSDDLTLQFLSGLDRTFFIGLPLVIVGTFRADEASPSLERLAKSEACASFSLRSLDESALAKMVGDMLAIDRPPEHLVRFLTRESRGNPFFTAEYLRYL